MMKTFAAFTFAIAIAASVVQAQTLPSETPAEFEPTNDELRLREARRDDPDARRREAAHRHPGAQRREAMRRSC